MSLPPTAGLPFSHLDPPTASARSTPIYPGRASRHNCWRPRRSSLPTFRLRPDRSMLQTPGWSTSLKQATGCPRCAGRCQGNGVSAPSPTPHWRPWSLSEKWPFAVATAFVARVAFQRPPRSFVTPWCHAIVRWVRRRHHSIDSLHTRVRIVNRPGCRRSRSRAPPPALRLARTSPTRTPCQPASRPPRTSASRRRRHHRAAEGPDPRHTRKLPRATDSAAVTMKPLRLPPWACTQASISRRAYAGTDRLIRSFRVSGAPGSTSTNTHWPPS